ncbi:MAG TPA: DUF4129 domain-containing protein [Gemmataceae bacterium]|nr:DUF4129 domain-containing protein [Gemmataceae bacterium]
MAAEKPRPSTADYVAIGLSPLLIMALIGSLVYFLVEILYRGDYEGRLQYILFFYVFGAVLVARISMEFGISDRAPLYGLVLAVATWIGLLQFVEYPGGLQALAWVINAGLIALVWWSAYRLTYDCTYIDEKAESTGTGLLQAAGLEGDAPPPQVEPEPDPEGKGKRKKKSQPGWWERYQQYRERRQKTRPPGVWVVYFSLAALPIFGLGQSLIPPEELEHRRYVFWLMGIYVASGLGLLVTTAFLGLRRYLRQRGLQMPKKMTIAWLTAGGVLTLALLVVGAILPRPDAEYSLLDLAPAKSKTRDASDYAMKDGEGGKGEGRPGEQRLDKDGKPVNTGDPKQKGQGGQGQAQGQGGSGNQGQQQGDKGQQGEKGDKSDKTKGESGDQKGPKEQGKDGQKAEGDSKGGGDKSPPSQAKKKASDWGSKKGTSRSPSGSLAFLGNVAPVLKWIVFGIIAVVVVIFILRGGLRYLANFFDWARRLLESLRAFWEGLFGRRAVATEAAGEGDVEERRAEPRPFRYYRNPFQNGRAEEMSPAELVRYSFEALEAWGFEHDLPRMTDETPIEFADRVGRDVPGLEGDAKKLAALYARVLYARGGLPASWREVVEQFWEKLEAVAEQPMSA